MSDLYEMMREMLRIDRRGLLGLAIASVIVTAPWTSAGADMSPTAPIERLNEALLTAMKAGGHSSFDERYRTLAPVVEQVFNLDTVLAASIGLSWSTMTDAQKAQLATAFRRYTVSSYVSNFDSYSGQSFEILPTTRTLPNGDVVVQTRLLRVNNSPLRLDYVMRRGPAGWQGVDVLTDGAISRVAVQRSDFRGLLMAGGVSALAEGLGHKVANLTGNAGGGPSPPAARPAPPVGLLNGPDAASGAAGEEGVAGDDAEAAGLGTPRARGTSRCKRSDCRPRIPDRTHIALLQRHSSPAQCEPR